MRVIITYNNITGEDLEKLLENADVEDVKIVSGTSTAVENWLETRDINGHGVSLAYNEFCEENPSTKISLINFSKAVRATGKYETKNIRIGDSVQRAFVGRDGTGI